MPDVPDFRALTRDLSAHGNRWAIATPHTAATDAGAAAFERGGNAVDAALAAAVTLAVVYPHMCGVGGDLFAVVAEPDGEMVAINSSGRSPAALDVDAVRRAHREVPQRGPIPVTVPGAVAGWWALLGRGAALGWPSAFETAIRAAHDGVPVAPSLAATLAWDETFASDPGLGALGFPHGRPLSEGDTLEQPALGSTLEAIAREGPDAMYRGEVGRRYVEGLRALGSAITTDDLASHAAEILPPLRAAFRDHHVSVAPPNSQGFVLLQILSLIERLQLDPDPLGVDAARIARVFRATGADRDRHLADPDAMTAHVSTLLDDGHLAALADEVRGDMAAPPRRPTGDTIALVAIDAGGYAVSLIQSLYNGFGAGILEPSTGIVAHDRGACFVLEPGHPNDLAPAKRPLHTLLPAVVHGGDGRVSAVAGTMGGFAQPQIDAQALIRSLVLGSGAADAVAAPRWLVTGMDRSAGDAGWAVAEADVPSSVVEALVGAGFRVDTVPAGDEGAGHAHLIRAGTDGFDAGTDPRADGSAAAG
ncbi:MAG TPA: gamma-glutamyltransferase [Actinomycetota bacterium]|nr:gamma-glutamyltransferase [Actinomycetota bacterium]